MAGVYPPLVTYLHAVLSMVINEGGLPTLRVAQVNLTYLQSCRYC